MIWFLQSLCSIYALEGKHSLSVGEFDSVNFMHNMSCIFPQVLWIMMSKMMKIDILSIFIIFWTGKERNGEKIMFLKPSRKVQNEMCWNYCRKEAICLAVPTPYDTKAYTRLLFVIQQLEAVILPWFDGVTWQNIGEGDPLYNEIISTV